MSHDYEQTFVSVSVSHVFRFSFWKSQEFTLKARTVNRSNCIPRLKTKLKLQIVMLLKILFYAIEDQNYECYLRGISEQIFIFINH